MVHDRLAQLQATLGAGLVQRATLFVNHLLASEPAALARLTPHAGRRIELSVAGAPAWLQTTPLVFEVTRAGRLDLVAGPLGAPPELRVTLDASDPLTDVASWLGGERGAVTTAGDAAFAADVDWLIANLRWSAADDLEPFVGRALSYGLARAGAVATTLAREALGALESLRKRGDPSAR